jgi:hypothetical protein
VNEQTVDLTKVAVPRIEASDYREYDIPSIFGDSHTQTVFETRTIHKKGNQMELHDFMPWGWPLDFPILREFNVAGGQLYNGNATLYAMRGIKFTPRKGSKRPILEQLADKWLEIYVAQNDNREFVLAGASLGSLFASIIASKAKAYDIKVPHLYINEPAGVSPKSFTQIRKQMTHDTEFELKYSSERLGNKNLKVDIAKYLLGNLSNERKIINNILKGELFEYVNKYLEAGDGQVHFFHGADSSFITNEDIKLFHEKIEFPNRIQYSHITGLRHGVGPNYRELAVWLIEYIAKSQKGNGK